MDAGGRPKEWNGEPSGFDDFAFKFSNWLSVPGGVSDHGSADSVGNAYTMREGRSRDSTAGSDRWKGSELHPASS